MKAATASILLCCILCSLATAGEPVPLLSGRTPDGGWSPFAFMERTDAGMYLWVIGIDEPQKMERIESVADDTPILMFALAGGVRPDSLDVRVESDNTVIHCAAIDIMLQKEDTSGNIVLGIYTDDVERIVAGDGGTPILLSELGDAKLGLNLKKPSISGDGVGSQKSSDFFSLNDPFAILSEASRDIIKNPEVLNPILRKLINEHGEGWSLFDYLELSFNTITSGDRTGLAVDYSFKKDFDTWAEDEGNAVSGMNWKVDARGTVALEEGINPRNFIETKVALAYFQSRGGIAPGADISNQLNEIATAAADYETNEEFRNSRKYAEGRDLIKDRFSTQVYWELGVKGGLETDQKFEARNQVLGSHIAVDLKGWNRESKTSKWNLIDHPFALIRLLTGYDQEYTVRGSTFPTIRAGIDFVDPVDGDGRFAVDAGQFLRGNLEVAFKTPIARTGESDIYAVLSWRVYQEIDAASAIREAGLDQFSYFSGSIESDNGVFLSYGDGKLPLSDSAETFYELGWKFGL